MKAHWSSHCGGQTLGEFADLALDVAEVCITLTICQESELGRCPDHQMIRGARHCLELHFSDSLNLLSHLLLARDQLMVQCAEGSHHRATVGYLDVAVGPCGRPYAT